jgi:methionine-rich copper-binding protein CopC
MKKPPAVLRTGWLILLLYTLSLLTAQSTLAHAVLQRSEPIVNANLLNAPSEIRLWFSEPLEAKYSAITLNSGDGVVMTTLASVVDAADPRQMYLPLYKLADGVYTVTWRTVSATSGQHTSITPVRDELIQRMVLSGAGHSSANPWLATKVVDDLQIHLAITPGWIGENTLLVALHTLEEEPVLDVSLIHVRLAHESAELAPSELHITKGENGIYPVQTASFHTAGDWQIDLTIQRPGKTDTIGRFRPEMVLRPALPSATDLDPPRPYRAVVFWWIGVWTLALGGYFVSQQGWRFWRDVGLLATGLMMIGGLFLMNLLN